MFILLLKCLDCFVLKCSDSVPKMLDFVLKMLDFVLKMFGFCRKDFPTREKCSSAFIYRSILYRSILYI